MILKQNIKNHIIVSEFTLTTVIILLVAWWYFEYDSAILLIGGLFHLFFSIPAIYLHLEYSIKNWGEEIEINSEEILVRKKGIEKRYAREILSKVFVYRAASMDNGGIPFSAMEYYRFLRIITKTGEEITITCLMIRDLDKVVEKLNGIPYVRKKGICTLIRKS